MARAFPSRIVRRSIATMPRRSGSAALSTFRDRRRASRRSRKSRAALRLGLGQMTATSPNFILLDSTRPDIANLVAAMLQARNAVKRRSWSHPARAHGRRMVGRRACSPSRSKARAAHRCQASVLSARRRKARDHTRRVQQMRLAGCVFTRRAIASHGADSRCPARVQCATHGR